MLENDFEHPEVLAEAILLVSQLDAESFPVVWDLLLKRAGAKFEVGMVPRQLASVVVARWAMKNPATAFTAAQKMPDGRRCCMIAWETWHATDAPAAASAVRKMRSGAEDTIFPPVWKRLARAAPLLTQELLIEFRDLPVAGSCPTMAFQRWMQSRGYSFETANDVFNQDLESGTVAETDRNHTIQFLDSLPALNAVTLRGCVLWLEYVTHDTNTTGPAEGCLPAVLRRLPPQPAERHALAAWIQEQPHLSDDLRSALLEHLTSSQ